jgi:hypothetical protein
MLVSIIHVNLINSGLSAPDSYRDVKSASGQLKNLPSFVRLFCQEKTTGAKGIKKP